MARNRILAALAALTMALTLNSVPAAAAPGDVRAPGGSVWDLLTFGLWDGPDWAWPAGFWEDEGGWPLPPGTGDRSTRQTFAVYQTYHEGADAITYVPGQVPVGATGRITVTEFGPDRAKDGAERTKVAVRLTGLQPNRDYGAHLHVRPCGPTGEDAGPHFQQKPAPEGVSGDPRYANPDNEVWLDFRTDLFGDAVTTAVGDWDLEGRAMSFVIHERRTDIAPGRAGEAGARLACQNLHL